ncbi:MAG: hypothetical protein QM696_14100 [Steroidobacteraceae bacterium]
MATPAGEGIWKTVTAFGNLRRYYADPVNQAVGFYGTLSEGNDGIIVTVRMKVEGRKISEAEWIIARKDTGGPGGPQPGLTSIMGAELSPPPDVALPKDQRLSRGELVAITNSYFDSLQSVNEALFLANPAWKRLENGIGTGEGPGGWNRNANAPYQGRSAQGAAGGGPGGAAAVGPAQGVCGGMCGVVARRYPIVDEEAGVVLGIVLFIRQPGATTRRNLLSEWFEIRGGKVSGIYASMHYLNPSLPAPNWPPYEGNWPLPANFFAPADGGPLPPSRMPGAQPTAAPAAAAAPGAPQ